MEFWIILDVVFLLFFLFFSLFLSEKNKRYSAIFLLAILTIISAFRYGTGVDYPEYELLYYEDVTYKEPMFDFIIYFLKSFGFSAQMMFLVYSCLTSVFVWKGITAYFFKAQQILFGVILYGVIDGLWLFSMNGMRQGLSMALIFWGANFLLKNKFKNFIFIWIIAILGHFASIVTVVMICLVKIRARKIIHICIMITAFVLGKSMDIESIVISILYYCNDLFGIGYQYIKYITLLTQDSLREGTGLGAIFSMAMSIIILFSIDNRIKLNNFVCNMLTLTIVIRSFFWFSEPFLRIRRFSEFFLLVGIILMVDKLNRRDSLILSLLVIIIYSIMELNLLNSLSKGVNITYIMNFKLLN